MDQYSREFIAEKARLRPEDLVGYVSCEAKGLAYKFARVGYPFDSGSHKMLWSRESIYQEANPEVTALARRGAA